MIKSFIRDESGASAAEYALILAVVGPLIGGAALELGRVVQASVQNASGDLYAMNSDPGSGGYSGSGPPSGSGGSTGGNGSAGAGSGSTSGGPTSGGSTGGGGSGTACHGKGSKSC